MSETAPQYFKDIEACVDAILDKVGNRIVLGLPLGLGKPVILANALYQRAKKKSDISLKIVTALSLEKPTGKSKLETNFLEPFVEREFAGVPDLDYVLDLRAGKMPKNIEVQEFFFKAGSYLHSPSQQQNYVSSNYTHAARDLMLSGVNVVAQMVAKKDIDGKTFYSFSCNPDLSIDLVPMLREKEQKGDPVAIVGEVNRNLPFMHNHAVFQAESADMIIDNPEYDYALFGAPSMAISPTDHMIGFHASTLIKDGGTLQVGIGSLGSALVSSCVLRHKNNSAYRELAEELELSEKFPILHDWGGLGTFEEGLYGCSEMLVDGFMHLYHAGILKREVYDDTQLQELLNRRAITQNVSLETLDILAEEGLINAKLRSRDVQYLKQYGILKESVEYKGGALLIEGQPVPTELNDIETRKQLSEHGLGACLKGGVLAHGGFFLGPKEFYRHLQNLTEEEHQKFCMTSVNFINHLYDHPFGRQDLKRAQRKDARFVNSAMMVTLNGGAVSDGLSDGRVVSGVGGQYNFVAMAHELSDARSILKLKSTRVSGGQTLSNIVFNYGHITIPRHLRDIVVTEYGIADLLGKSDKDVYIELIKVSDSRFQDQLLEQAKKIGKVPADYELPLKYRQNTPEKIQQLYRKYNGMGYFQPFPFDCSFTDDELRLGKALKSLKAKTATKLGLIKCLLKAMTIKSVPAELEPLMHRMKLNAPSDFKEKLEQRMLAGELMNAGMSGVSVARPTQHHGVNH
ncbi:acetyl-CoA hydrolase/transferase C-terminal domain-containing protein [Hahella ganghwensis]|uniref:acetyl-CoA hydrolase/transferase C-terminal domain-containing protein n=1 Tax=Hahella ganghwensis TaxID=286420 RepID=UPI00036F0B93|nr:acetyl-CoA hydrolase/transferase C-terminal domain-containing protein [Hahella ganghwensis]